MPVVAMPNGDQVNFPDDMPPDQIKSLIAKKFPHDVASHFSNVAQALRTGMSWEDVAKTAVSNIPSSAGKFVEATVQPILHPIQTAQSLKEIGLGVLEKSGLVSGKDNVKYADAVGKFLADRYGGTDNLKNTIANDPVGFLADASMLLSGGGTAAARVPGAIGKAGEIAQAAGRVTNPLSAVAPVAKVAGKLAGEGLGISTGAGYDAIKTAAQAGAEGGEASKAFLQNLTGKTPVSDVVEEAKRAALQLKLDRGEAYRANMAKVGADKTILDFGKIDAAVDKVTGVQKFKAAVISDTAEGVKQKINAKIDEWKQLATYEPQEYSTVDGLDALKQAIGKIRDNTQYGTPDRYVADAVYKSVYKTIADQSPEYAKAMNGYEEASDIIREVEGTLSLKPNANVDTSLRKLQSVLRNNVNTNYGRRKELVELLQKAGAKNLMQKLAGQALSSAAPRGIAGRLLAGGEAALALGDPTHALRLMMAIPASSPFLVGAGAYGAGAATRLPLRGIGQTSFQAGRQEQP